MKHRKNIGFWDKVVKTESCWVWQGAFFHGSKTGEKTYGMFWRAIDNKCMYAHRHAYEILMGPIKEGFDLHHTCENKACVNPAHLEQREHSRHAKESQEKDWERNYGKRVDASCNNRWG